MRANSDKQGFVSCKVHATFSYNKVKSYFFLSCVREKWNFLREQLENNVTGRCVQTSKGKDEEDKNKRDEFLSFGQPFATFMWDGNEVALFNQPV